MNDGIHARLGLLFVPDRENENLDEYQKQPRSYYKISTCIKHTVLTSLPVRI